MPCRREAGLGEQPLRIVELPVSFARGE